MSKKIYATEAYELVKKDLRAWAKEKGVKLSIRKNHYNSFSFTIVSYKESIITKDCVQNINENILDQYDEITPNGKQLIKEMRKIILKYHWDESDYHTDYFHCAFYYRISIGNWEKPFQVK